MGQFKNLNVITLEGVVIRSKWKMNIINLCGWCRSYDDNYDDVDGDGTCKWW